MRRPDRRRLPDPACRGPAQRDNSVRRAMVEQFGDRNFLLSRLAAIKFVTNSQRLDADFADTVEPARPAEDGKWLEAVFNLAKDDELILTRRQRRLGGAVCKANLAKLRVPSEIAGTRQANRVFGLARSDMEGPGTHHHIAAPRNVNDRDGQGQVRENLAASFRNTLVVKSRDRVLGSE
jgi:hypothetical protein